MVMDKKITKNVNGQGLTEYIIIVALIAIAAIGIVGLFGDNIRHIFATSANALAGNENAESGAREASAPLYQHKNLKDFAKNKDKI